MSKIGKLLAKTLYEDFDFVYTDLETFCETWAGKPFRINSSTKFYTRNFGTHPTSSNILPQYYFNLYFNQLKISSKIYNLKFNLQKKTNTANFENHCFIKKKNEKGEKMKKTLWKTLVLVILEADH